MGIRIISTGSYLPPAIETVRSQSSLESNAPQDFELQFSGGHEHRVCQAHETSTYMGIMAAQNALAKGCIDPKSIDAVISYSGVADNETPRDVYGILNAIGCDGAMAWTIDTACASFMTHLHCANALSMTGIKRILILESMNWVNRAFSLEDKTKVPGSLAGDGSGAVIVESVPNRGSIIDILERTSTTDFDFITMASAQVKGNREYLKFTKSQKTIYRAFSILPETAHELLNKNGLCQSDVTWTITHQPGMNIIQKWHALLGLSTEHNLNTFNMYGNMSAANIPVTLDHFLNVDPKIQRGDIILAFTAGAGIHCVAALIEF